MFTTKKVITLAQLAKLQPVRPEKAGSTWHGIPHADMAATLLLRVRLNHWSPPSELEPFFALSNDEADLAMAVGVFMPELRPCPDYRPMVGLITSNARRKSTALFFGVRWRDDDFIVTDKIVLGRKRERTFNLNKRMDRAMLSVREAVEFLPGLLRRLQRHKVDRSAAEGLLCEAGGKILPWSRVGGARQEFFDLVEHKGTAFGLLLCINAEISRSPAMTQMEQRHAAAQLFYRWVC